MNHKKVWCVYKGADLRNIFSTYKGAIKFVATESGLSEEKVQEQYVTEVPMEADFSISEWEIDSSPGCRSRWRRL